MKLSINQVSNLITVRSDYFDQVRMVVIGHDKSSDKNYELIQEDIDRLGEYLDILYGNISVADNFLPNIFGEENGKTREESRKEDMRNNYRKHDEACAIVKKLAGLSELHSPRAWLDL